MPPARSRASTSATVTAARGGVQRATGPGHPAAHHDEVERLARRAGEARAPLAGAQARRAHPSSAAAITASATSARPPASRRRRTRRGCGPAAARAEAVDGDRDRGGEVAASLAPPRETPRHRPAERAARAREHRADRRLGVHARPAADQLGVEHARRRVGRDRLEHALDRVELVGPQSQNSSPPPGTTLNASPERTTVGTAVRRCRAGRVVAGGDGLRGVGQRQQRVAAAAGAEPECAARPGAVTGSSRPPCGAPPRRRGRRRRVAALEAQARVPAGEAVDVGERPRCATPRRRRAAAQPRRIARGAGRAARIAPIESTTPPFMSTLPEPTSLSPSRVSGRWSPWATTVSRWPSSSTRREPVPRSCATRSGAWPGQEHGRRSISASSGGRAAHTAAHSSAPWTSPEGDETPTSASSSRSARRPISAPASLHPGVHRAPRYCLRMPELPEMEIVARRLDEALPGEPIESALTPGINALKTFDPPLTRSTAPRSPACAAAEAAAARRSTTDAPARSRCSCT